MNKAHLELLQYNYEKACDAYVKAFAREYVGVCNTMDFCFTDDTYTSAKVGGKYYDFSVIKFAIDNEMKRDDLELWNEYNSVCPENKHIGIQDWCEGARVSRGVVNGYKESARERYTL